MAGNVLEFTDGNFQSEVLDSEQLTLVDFWAPWCGPCKQLGPTIEQLAGEYQGKVRIGKLNIDDNPGTPSKYGISGIPTVLFFKGGSLVDKKMGLAPKAQFTDSINKLIG